VRTGFSAGARRETRQKTEESEAGETGRAGGQAAGGKPTDPRLVVRVFRCGVCGMV